MATSTTSAQKRCCTCKQDLPLSEFCRSAGRPDGLNVRCRGCAAAKYKANRVAIREQQRLKNLANPQPNRDRVRQWQLANPERAAQAWQRHYQANRETLLEGMRQRYAQRRARVLAHYGEQCGCCGTTEDLSIDHINGGGGAHRKELFGDPRVGGDRFTDWLIRNDFPPGYQTLCMPCNASKREGERCRLQHEGGG